MTISWSQALALGLAASLVASPAPWVGAQPPLPPPTPQATEPGAIDWNAIDPGVRVVGEGYLDTDERCREFEREIWIGNRAEWVVGLACEMPDGSWRIVR